MPLTKENKEILNDFQSEHNRIIEEQFSQILTEKSHIRLFFINENRCFTDGRNITIDPAERELFVDKIALSKTEQYLNLDNQISSNPWLALNMQTRASNIHESLHIIYTNFNIKFYSDNRAYNEIRKLVLSDIRNIVEDGFIEAAGCSLYDNLEHYLLWNRIALYNCQADFPDTLEQRFSQAGIKIDTKKAYKEIETEDLKQEEQSQAESSEENNNKFAKLIVYLNYMACFILYPFLKLDDHPLPILEYVNKTKPVFLEAVVCGNANKRDEYVYQIFDIIEPLLPDDSDSDLNLPSSVQYLYDNLKNNFSDNSTFMNNSSSGKEVVITRRLFTDENGEPVSSEKSGEKIKSDIDTFKYKKENSKQFQENERTAEYYDSNNFDCSNLHRNITIEVIKPKINSNLKRAYQNLVSKYQLTINSHSSQIQQFLKINIEEKEEKKLFGSSIDSKHLSDIKKRYWHKNIITQNIPDISFLFMIDGSGSMEGERIDSVISAMIILHEVLKKNNILHSIVEHRAIYNEKLVIHNILLDFKYKNDEKYNILNLKASEGTREGLSLYWAEKHILKNSNSDYKVIIMISDGAPCHTCDDELDYEPPISVKDSAEAAKKIIKRGTNIIALSLDTPNDDSCYQDLKLIYQNVVSCVDMSKFTGQLLNIVSKLFKDGF